MGRRSKASPPRGGGSAKPGRRGYSKFAATSQSACGWQLPWEGSLWAAVVQGAENDCCFLGRDAA